MEILELQKVYDERPNIVEYLNENGVLLKTILRDHRRIMVFYMNNVDIYNEDHLPCVCIATEDLSLTNYILLYPFEYRIHEMDFLIEHAVGHIVLSHISTSSTDPDDKVLLLLDYAADTYAAQQLGFNTVDDNLDAPDYVDGKLPMQYYRRHTSLIKMEVTEINSYKLLSEFTSSKKILIDKELIEEDGHFTVTDVEETDGDGTDKKFAIYSMTPYTYQNHLFTNKFGTVFYDAGHTIVLLTPTILKFPDFVIHTVVHTIKKATRYADLVQIRYDSNGIPIYNRIGMHNQIKIDSEVYEYIMGDYAIRAFDLLIQKFPNDVELRHRYESLCTFRKLRLDGYSIRQ